MKKYIELLFAITYSFYVDTLAARGERLELLVNKTESLSASVFTVFNFDHQYCTTHFLKFYLVGNFPQIESQPCEILVLEEYKDNCCYFNLNFGLFHNYLTFNCLLYFKSLYFTDYHLLCCLYGLWWIYLE